VRLSEIRIHDDGRNMQMKIITPVEAIAQSTIALVARVKKSDGTYLLPTDATTIRVDLYDLADEFSQPQLSSTGTIIPPTVRTPVDDTGTPITDGSAYDSPAASEVVFSTLQTDGRWTLDSTGYNVCYKIATPLQDHIYEVRITFSLSNADTLIVAWQIDSQ
jgi:hypothetical protein